MTATAALRFELDLGESLHHRLRPDAVVVQEDRNLVMGSQPVLDLDADHDLDAAYRAVSRHRPIPQGRYLLLRPGGPRPWWVYQAVVHDLEMVPSCRSGDVRRSLTAVLEDAARRRLRSIACEPLGLFGDKGLRPEEMVDAFDSAIMEISLSLASPLRLIMLLGDLGEVERVSHLLRSKLLRQASRSFRTVSGESAMVEVCRESARLHFRFVPGSLSGYLVTKAPVLV